MTEGGTITHHAASFATASTADPAASPSSISSSRRRA